MHVQIDERNELKNEMKKKKKNRQRESLSNLSLQNLNCPGASILVTILQCVKL